MEFCCTRVPGRAARPRPGSAQFLQGQLSNDMARLTPERALLAGYHNPQGRTLALLRLVEVAPDELLAILPRELVPALITRLASSSCARR